MIYNGHLLKKCFQWSVVFICTWASTLTLTEELFTGDVQLPSDHHIRQIQKVFIYFFNLCSALFNNSERMVKAV